MERQDYLQQHGLEKLCSTYPIKVSRHQKYPHLVCLKYSQLESPLGEKIVRQCWGIILETSQLEAVYQQHQSLATQKDFALALKHLPYAGVLFSLRAGRTGSIKESLCQMPLLKLEELLSFNNINLGL